MIKERVSIIWGTKKNAIISREISGKLLTDLSKDNPLIKLIKKIEANNVILNHQVHGITGHIINNQENIYHPLLHKEGDYLITNQTKIALGVLTADCLPIILYNQEKHVVGIIHAGWKGAIQGVIQKTIDTLKKEFLIDPISLIVLCGPAAQICCYEVKDDFYERFKNISEAQHCFEKRDSKIFFSLSAYTNGILDQYNIPHNQRDFSAHHCTVCNVDYYSYRKDNKTEYRNITLVSLK
jgi:YfiH family protein